MDKKNTLLGLLCIAAAIALFVLNRPTPEAAAAQKAAQTQALNTPAPTVATPAPEAPKGAVFAAPEAAAVREYTLENDYIKVVFTSQGGAIDRVVFKKFAEFVGEDEPKVAFNRGAAVPALALGMGQILNPLSSAAAPAFVRANFAEIERTDTSIRFALDLENGLRIERSYAIAAADATAEPYLILHKTTLENRGKAEVAADVYWLNIGAMPPTEDDTMRMLSIGTYDGEDDDFEPLDAFTESKGFLGFGSNAAKPFILSGEHIRWAAVRNQFFAAILAPKNGLEGVKLFAKVAELPAVPHPSAQTDAASGAVVVAAPLAPVKGLEGALSFAGAALAPGARADIEVGYYAGPKEYVRLDRLGENQDIVVDFGWTGFISKAMLLFLIGIHSLLVFVAPSWAWGWAIIVVTIIIKLLIWPLTAVQTRSAKRMAQIQGPLKEMRERYKDNPQRMQQETIKLFREHKVNPMAGCLPLLVQLPIFIGLFYMLRSAPELRFAPFLWFDDLSAPDTVGYLGSFPIHILPLLMGATMMLQMRLAPSPSADPMQRRIFQFMPLIFLVFCYAFPSGLVLYWTVQNLFTILQQWLTNRSKDDPVPAAAAVDTRATRMQPIKPTRKNR